MLVSVIGSQEGTYISMLLHAYDIHLDATSLLIYEFCTTVVIALILVSMLQSSLSIALLLERTLLKVSFNILKLGWEGGNGSCASECLQVSLESV